MAVGYEQHLVKPINSDGNSKSDGEKKYIKNILFAK